MTVRVLCSVPPSLSPTATSEPSGDGSYQSIATAASAARCAGSSSVRAGASRSTADRTTNENWSAPSAAFEHEQPLAANDCTADRRQRGERGKALVPRAPGRPGFERLFGSFVVGGHPGRYLLGITVFEPPIRIGDGNAVQHLDIGAAPC